jgi:hypothetical protein
VIAPHSIGMIHNSQWKADASGDYADLTALNRHADLVQGQFMEACGHGLAVAVRQTKQACMVLAEFLPRPISRVLVWLRFLG